MSIVSRIRAQGGDVTRKGYRLSLRRGGLDARAVEWVKAHRDEIMREIWPRFDDWCERAAIREFDGGQPRDEAEAAAYREIEQC